MVDERIARLRLSRGRFLPVCCPATGAPETEFALVAAKSASSRIFASSAAEKPNSGGDSVKGDARDDRRDVMVMVRPGAEADCRMGCCEVDE